MDNYNVTVTANNSCGMMMSDPTTVYVRVRFVSSKYTGKEYAGYVLITLELNGGTLLYPFNVTIIPSEQSPVSAEGGVDFDTTTLTATFASGMISSSVSVPVMMDNIVEGLEEFDLTLNVSSSLAPAITAGGRDSAVGVIVDSTMLVVEFTSGQFTGSESSGFIEVIVRIIGGSSSTPITVTVTPSVQSPVSAMGSGIDFYSTIFSITINAGATDGRANVSVTCDNVIEELELFNSALTNISGSAGVTLGRDTCVGQIIDSTVVVNFFQLSYGVMEDDGSVNIMILLNQRSSVEFQVTISTADITAVAGEDYNGNLITVNFSAGVVTVTLTININDNSIVECNEMFSVAIVSVTTCGVTIGRSKITKVFIRDDDGATVSLSRSQYSVVESDNSITGTITLSSRTSKDVIVEVTIIDGSANAGVDYAMSTALVFNITISAGLTLSSFSIDIINDMIQEDNETFSIAIRLLPSCLSLSLGTSSSTVMIIDDDVALITFTSSTCSGLESSGVISTTIAILGGIVSSEDINITITFIEGSASATDFNFAIQTLTIIAGANSSMVNVPVTDDDIVEGDEIFIMSLSIPSSLGPEITTGSITGVTVTIIDTTKLSVGFVSSNYTGSEVAKFVVVILELSRGISAYPFNVTVFPLEQSPVSAEGGVDFDSTRLTTTFASGMTMSNFSVPVMMDNIVEGHEEFDLILFVPSSLAPAITAGGRDRAVGVIVDSTMLMVEFTSGQFTGSESSGVIEFIVRITGGSSITPITVIVTPSEQSLVSAKGSGIDFNSTTFSITINAGATDGRANVSVTCDNVTEGLEFFNLALTITSDSAGVKLGRDTCVGQIIDNTVIVSFNQLSYGVMEGEGLVNVMLLLSQPSSVEFQVTISTADVTAVARKDYSGSQYVTVNVPASATIHSFTINITDSIVDECNEKFNLTIVSVTTCGVTIRSNRSTEVLIRSADTPLVTAPTVTATPLSSTSFTVSWTITDLDHNYIITWTNLRTGMMDNMTVSENTNSYTVTGLSGMDNYNVTVTANNSCGMMMSDPITVYGPSSSAPMNIRFSSNDVTSESFVIQWDAVIDIFPVKYTVRWYDGDHLIGMSSVNGLSYTVTGLTSNTSYTVTVTAYNVCCGEGENGAANVTTNMRPPTEPPTTTSATSVLPTPLPPSLSTD